MVAPTKNSPSESGSAMVMHALRYARLGLPVFPCKRQTKAPIVKRGFKAATRNEKQIRDWWAQWPDAMIGVPTGPASGIDVIDIDVKPQEFIDGFTFLPQWESLSLLIVRTPSGGAHLWFKSDGKVRNSTDRLAPGIDTRGDGGYVIVPPSANHDRARYEFMRGSLGDLDKLPNFPTKLLDRSGPKDSLESNTQPEADPERITAAMAVIPNDNLGWDDWKRLGLAIFRATSGSDQGFHIFDQWSRKSSKYDEANTRREWDSIYRSPPTRIGAGTIFFEADRADLKWRRAGKLMLQAESPVESAKEFVRRLFVRNDAQGLVYYRGAFYEWTCTHWVECDADHLRSQVYEFLDDALKSNGTPFNATATKVNQVIDALQAVVEVDARWNVPFWLDEPNTRCGHLIACRNGLLDPNARILTPHSPRFFNVNCLPFDYVADALTPRPWRAFLRQLWPDDDDGKTARLALQEIFGLLLTSDTSFQKLFMLVGPPRSGKGTIGRVLGLLLGADNIASPSMASLSGDFGLSQLIDKNLAIISDARHGTRATSHAVAERLLSVSGEDAQTINRKHKNYWSGRLTTRFLMLTNELPNIADASGAFASRFVILTLTNSFLGKEDTNLTHTLSKELSGILNWSLRGLERLRSRGFFRMPQSSTDAMQRLSDLASPISAFLRDWCARSPEAQVNVKVLYNAWKYWCEANGIPPGSAIVFGRDLHARCPEITYGGRGAKRFYRGIELNTLGRNQYEKKNAM
ncbi:phage/plasmid primase, P4 family [Bradyrhizobium sp. 26S5]|uniref:phage/plasmid primase, P4 family n=1 Tax=Bradyrhizobium sp. 26S5 TaxID=3139729 RepID=UPI0030CF1F61